MEKNRLEAFSDGVIAIIITIMVLELKVPETLTWAALHDVVPHMLSYALSFIYVAIYWNNHHHMLHTIRHVNGRILWANMHLLFWLSLIPFATAWLGHNPLAPVPVALYGIALLLPAIAYFILQNTIICAQEAHGVPSLLKRAIGRDGKGKASPVLYAVAVGLAFVQPLSSLAIYCLVALMWIIPDQRIERLVDHPH